MDLLPFNAPCAACCCLEAAFRFCVFQCIPDGHGGFENASAIGQQEFPHLHKTCKRCEYEWLEKCLGLPEQKA